MDPVLLGSTLFSVGSSVAQSVANDRRAKEANEWSEKMYKQQVQDNLKYNSPSFQVQRLKEAGLNPNFAYNGDQTFSPASAPSGAQNPSNIDLSAMSDLAFKQAQIDNLNADSEVKRKDAEGKSIENEMNSIYLANLPESERLRLDNAQQDLRNKVASHQLTLQQANNLIEDTALKEAQKGQTEAEKKYIEAQTKYVGWYAQLKGYEMQVLAQDSYYRGLQTLLNGLQTGADIDIKKAEKDLREAEAAKSKYEADNYWKTTGLPKYLGSFIALIASALALKKVGKTPPSDVVTEKPVIVQPGSPHWPSNP